MPEGFTVDVCSEAPCHWTPRPTLASLLDNIPNGLPSAERQNEETEGNKPIPGAYGNHQPNKRAAEPEPLSPPTPENQSRSGPPLPEWPNTDEIEPITYTKGKSLDDIDPDIQKIAAEREQAAETAKKKIQPPESFHPFIDSRYILRPEAIESVFYMWRITGDPSWQEKGWHMWESIEQASWTELAYSAIANVNDVNSTKTDSMERYISLKWSCWCGSFWLAETLKYFYLLYSEPDIVSLDDWVFNTEAHPFKRTKPDLR
jgi:Glycosyl hydrolase family 47